MWRVTRRSPGRLVGNDEEKTNIIVKKKIIIENVCQCKMSVRRISCAVI